MRPITTTLVLTLAMTGPALADDAENRAAVEAFYEVFNDRSPERLPDVVTEDYVLHGTSPSLPDGTIESFAQALAGFATGVPDATYTVEAMHVANDTVTVRGTISGTHEGVLFGVPATDRPVEFGAIDVHRVEDGRIAESWHVEDFATMLRQIGVLPAGE